MWAGVAKERVRVGVAKEVGVAKGSGRWAELEMDHTDRNTEMERKRDREKSDRCRKDGVM